MLDLSKNIKNIVFVPSWTAMMALRFMMPKSHPWKNDPPDFKEWVEGSSQLLYEMSVILTFCIFSIFILALTLSF